jgi:hypothetical protein
LDDPEGGVAAIEAEVAHLLLGTVADVAAFLEKGLNFRRLRGSGKSEESEHPGS